VSRGYFGVGIDRCNVAGAIVMYDRIGKASR
jgi:hypothetical protein